MQEEKEIEFDLEQQIKENAFKKEIFVYPVKNKQGVPYTLNALTHIKILDKARRKRSLPLGYRAELKNVEWKEGNIINLSEKQLLKIEYQNKICEKFIRRVTSVVYICRHAKKEILANIEQSTIEDSRRFLSKQIYGKSAINAAMKILEKDLKAQIKKNEDYLYPPPSKKQSPPLLFKNHENEALAEIYGLYNKYFSNLNQRNILANMAFIVAATDFWEDEREFIDRVTLYFERLGNRRKELEGSYDIKAQTSFILPDD